MIILQLLGNPLGDLSEDVVESLRSDFYRLAEAVWVHVAPLDEVRRLAMRAQIQPEAVRMAVLDFAESYTPIELMSFVPSIMQDAEHVEAALAGVIPEGQPPKNGLSIS